MSLFGEIGSIQPHFHVKTLENISGESSPSVNDIFFREIEASTNRSQLCWQLQCSDHRAGEGGRRRTAGAEGREEERQVRLRFAMRSQGRQRKKQIVLRFGEMRNRKG